MLNTIDEIKQLKIMSISIPDLNSLSAFIEKLVY